MEPFGSTSVDLTESSVHRLDARSKLFIVLVYSICLFFDDSWASLGISALLFLFASYLSHVSLLKILRTGYVVYFLVAITIVCNSFAFVDGHMAFSQVGFLNGLYFGTRIILLVWMSLILCFTTTPEQINDAISSLLKPLSKLKVPTDDIAMTFSIAIRFLPQCATEFMSIKDAQWSRGASFDEGSFFVRARSYVTIFVPMIVSLFRRSDALAISMDCRCYGLNPAGRGHLRRSSFTASDALPCIVFCSICVLSAILL